MSSKKLKIALLAPFEEPVPPKKYGGTERVVNNLANQLVAMGHNVTLFASGDSETPARLVPCVEQAIRVLPESKNFAIRQALNLQGLANAIKVINAERYDLVHNHYGWQFLCFKDLIKQPIVTTLHGILSEPTENYMHRLFKQENFVSISFSQRKHADDLNFMATVYNGIDPKRFTYNENPEDYLVFLGRIHPQKGPDYAIEIARRTNHKLIIAAKIDPREDEYFDKDIKPLIDGKQVVFVGEVGHADKVKLLKNAKAMLAPIQWDEPFGITNIEAMACGTPVIAIGRGSLPEIIQDGKSGFLCNTINQMVKSVDQIDKIKRQDCRLRVEEKFSSTHMAEGYLRVYQRLISKSS